MASLLPENHSEFRTQQYWNDFFIKRQATTTEDDGNVESTFEWYGDWSDMSSVVAAYIPPSTGEVLVIGCGNSTTSEDMFAQGYTCVTSIDFSDVVIQEMTDKTVDVTNTIADQATSWLRYEKMDFLNMEYPDGRFRLVFDKGALDALMADDTPRSKKDAATLFQEIDRVVGGVGGVNDDEDDDEYVKSEKQAGEATQGEGKERGVYVCVTLAQKHIMSALFRHFGRPGSLWDVHVHTFSPRLGSALCPFAFVAVRREQPHVGMPPITTHFDNLSSTGNTGDDEKNELSDVGGTIVNMGQAIRSIIAMQQTHNFLGGPIKPGCAITLHLWPQHGSDEKEKTETKSANTGSKAKGGPRFTVTVLDAEHPTGSPAHGANSCGVFIVPQGREVEFLFNTTEGQMDLAGQAGFARFIVVAMERGHDFSGGLDQVKRELDPYMSKLAPPSNSPFQIPYLTTGTDSLGSRVEMHSGKSEYSGEYAVEEVVTDEDDGIIVRRLIFLDNSNLVQSEVRLGVREKKKKQHFKNKKKNANPVKNSSSDNNNNHNNNYDDEDEDEEEKDLVPDHSHLTFEFHLTLACSIGMLNDTSGGKSNGSQGKNTRVLVVGLGGGCLPMFLHEHFAHVQLTCVEIDSEMADIATNWFGYAAGSERMQTVIGDGIHYIENLPSLSMEEKFHVVIFDVDAKDALSTGVSFPPKEFLDPTFLQHVASNVLSEEGMLCINVASRSKSFFEKTIEKMQNVFSVVDVVKYEDSLNRIVFAYKSGTLDERSFSSEGGLEPLGGSQVLRRLKMRSTKDWSSETDDDIIEAMSDTTNCV